MNLDRMIAIARDLDPVDRMELGGGVVIPRLAGGAGGNWALSPRDTFASMAVTGVLEPGSTSHTVAQPLLGADRPRVMTAWLITGLRIPCSILIVAKAKPPAEKLEAVATINLLVDGEVAFAQSQNVPLTKTGIEEKKLVANFLAAADLTNPIRIDQRHQLAIEGVVTTPVQTEAGESLEIRVGAIVTTTKPEGGGFEFNNKATEGKIYYTVQELTGHRVLA